ncbi:hypothetical protein [Chitinophaga solisilvae]|uniref:Uncharacterized protein n=1 Tax=Chitinophaga solisilvae TaxID=1233460 RepID=A0A3S1D4Y8_9BACT|nr:hypothetical protein [Chitinophaga solisilvae]NSL86193.1 hypothetical protein [Chitinophaga solisilvae]
MAEEKKESLMDRVRAHFAYMKDFFSEYNALLGEDKPRPLPSFTDEEMMIYCGHPEGQVIAPEEPPVAG